MIGSVVYQPMQKLMLISYVIESDSLKGSDGTNSILQLFNIDIYIYI